MPLTWICTWDHYVGELVGFLKKLGQLDNTLIITVSDNGAPALKAARMAPSAKPCSRTTCPQPAVDFGLRSRLKEWGGPNTYPHYSWGWAWATNTPFRKWKEVVARGGTSDLCIVHWPKGIKAKGEIRHQFVHAIDLVPTTLEVLNAKLPTSINGVAQAPIEGVSFAKTFDDPKAPLPREAQYLRNARLGGPSSFDGWRSLYPRPIMAAG